MRDWYDLRSYRLTAKGHCPRCGGKLAGWFDARPGSFGRKRMPVVI